MATSRTSVANSMSYKSTPQRDLAYRQFSAGRGRFIGIIWPNGSGEAPPVEAEASHFFAQGPSRDVEPLHDDADFSPGLHQASLDEGAFERVDLLREREPLALRGLQVRQQRLAQAERVALGGIAQ